MARYHGGIEVPPLSRAQLRMEALALWRVLGLDRRKEFPVMQMLEHGLYGLYPDYEFSVETMGAMGDDHGRSYPDSHRILIREDVYSGACERRGRDRFTVMHEISHLLLHEGVPVALKRSSADIPAYRNSEWQADALAGEILMPNPEIRGMTVQEIASVYGVSANAAMTQLKASR